jgi:hypothetical protein
MARKRGRSPSPTGLGDDIDRLSVDRLHALWDELAGRAGPRQRRLYCCAACRLRWHWLSDEARGAVAVAEQFADGQVGARKLASARTKGMRARHERTGSEVEGSVAYGFVSLATTTEQDLTRIWTDSINHHAGWDETTLPTVRANLRLLRDIVGPAARPALVPSWQTPAAVAIARQVYDERDFAALPILADALEEAGCAAEQVLDHLRGPGAHVRGCWVVDWLLARE